MPDLCSPDTPKYRLRLTGKPKTTLSVKVCKLPRLLKSRISHYCKLTTT